MQASFGDPRAVDSNVKTILMSCLKGQQVIIKMEAMKIIHPEKFSELQAAPPRYAPAPRREPPAAPKGPAGATGKRRSGQRRERQRGPHLGGTWLPSSGPCSVPKGP